ncbi:MAG: hypothetical protein WBC91_15805 [Phototrophicaceae bacterium]
MSAISFKELDARIQQTKISDLIAFNTIGERKTIEQRVTLHTFIMFLFSGVFMLISSLFNTTGTVKDYIQIVLAVSTILLMTIAYFQSSKISLLSIAAVLIAYGVYNLILLTLLNGTFHISSILVGSFQILIALTYIQEAKQFDDLTASIPDAIDETLYEDVFEALKTQQPNHSNQLIELKHSRQTITVWLRSASVVILLEGDNRLYFDIHKVFKLSSSVGNDTGGNMLAVDANIIDRSRKCYISRHGWLRYTQFTQ